MSIIVALDVNNQQAALTLADQLDPELCRLKVGKELFTQLGSQIIKDLHARHFEIFLDLKFHDIPNTTAQAVLAAAEMGVWMVNVHASGGRQMMETSVNRLKNANYKTKIIAVTVLTSMSEDDLKDVGISVPVHQHVHHLAQLAQDSGLDGVVCSAQEAKALKNALGPDFLLVTPGIRPEHTQQDDQKRIMTPQQAILNGVDYMVIGRPITKAQSPSQQLQQIFNSIQ